MCVFIKQMGNSMHVCVALNKLGSWHHKKQDTVYFCL